MTLTRYEPWGLLNQLSRELVRLQGAEHREEPAFTSDWSPAVDIREEADGYVLHADLPGVAPGDIEIHMEKGVLTLRGERALGTEEERQNYKRIERVRGSFFRSFALPDTADSDNISARCQNGVLEVRIPKHAKVLPRRIEVEH
jgi:HSP20 family protein